MSRDRYFEIQRYLHFCDNENSLPNKLFKIETILNKLKENFQNQVYPFENLVIDESMVLFKGRLSFKHYIKTKKHRFGIKLYVLCDCKTGAETNIKTDKKNDIGTSGTIVAKLIEPYLNKGHSLYTDNFYTSPSLATMLFDNKTNSCGTVRQNRKHMPIFDQKLRTGETGEAVTIY